MDIGVRDGAGVGAAAGTGLGTHLETGAETHAGTVPGTVAETDSATGSATAVPPVRGLDPVDARRISVVCRALRSYSTEGLLTELLEGVEGADAIVRLVARYCVFDHAALLVFVDDFDEALAGLAAFDLRPAPLVPSVIVRRRLGERYGVAPERLDVRLTHAGLDAPGVSGRTLEVFMLRRSPELPAGLVERERAEEFELHYAMRLPEPDLVVIQGLRTVLRERGGFAWDGGGYNPHDNAAAGGTSVLYFLRAAPDGRGGTRRARLEIKFRGDYSAVTTRNTEPAPIPAQAVPAQGMPPRPIPAQEPPAGADVSGGDAHPLRSHLNRLRQRSTGSGGGQLTSAIRTTVAHVATRAGHALAKKIQP